MSTILRGMGSDKIRLILGIERRFGSRKFSFREVSTLPEFDRAAFFRLYSDKMILRASKTKPLLYRLATRYSRKERGFVSVLTADPVPPVDPGNVTSLSGMHTESGGVFT
ncbi:hypothetical protein [Methanoregula sp.]|uniref:hypothetical protein n=1 Tax=Methanoregula sp. TaxID=2052170 RepID=UPI003C72A533